MEQEILINKEDTVKTEKELKNIFTRNILAQCGLPIDEYWPEDKIELDVKERIKLRDLLKKYEVEIIDIPGDSLNIYIDKELVGTWKKNRYVLCTDMSIINPLNRIYVKMYVEEWSVFDSLNEDDSEEIDSEFTDED